jgi:hypothetical protein
VGTLIQLQGEQAVKYRSFLNTYRNVKGKEPGPVERTEAFVCAISNDPWKRPSWTM